MVSVIMSTYNETEEMLNKAVNSILNQTYKDLEIIIVIDNPDNKPVVKRLKEFEKQDSRIKVYDNGSNLGRVVSLNKAIDLVSGEYLAIMDADDYSYPDRIEKELNFIVSSNYSLVCSCLRDMDENENVINPIIPDFVHNLGIGKELPKWMVTNGFYVGHATWLGKTSLFRKLKYREIRYAEDADLMLRVVMSGEKIGIWQEVLYDVSVRSASVSRKNAFTQHYSAMYLRNHYRHIDKAEKHVLKVTHSKRFTKMEENYGIADSYYLKAKTYYHNNQFVRASFFYLLASFKSCYYFHVVKNKIKYKLLHMYDYIL